jgi:hypothetical protein
MEKEKVSSYRTSISVPLELKPLIRQRAESLDLTVSQYIRKLVNSDGKKSSSSWLKSRYY